MFDLDRDNIINRIRQYFDPVILKRGWAYYQEGAVENLIMDKTSLRATVNGSIPYLVRVDLRIFSESSCDCPYDDYCKHMAAVLFEALEQDGWVPDDLLSPPKKQPVREMKRTEETAERPEPPANPPAQKRKKDVPHETDSVKEWHRYFAKKVSRQDYYGSYSLEMFLHRETAYFLPLCETWEPDKQRLYRIHLWLFLMLQIDDMYKPRGTRYSYYDSNYNYHRRQAEQWLHDLLDILHETNRQEIRANYPADLTDTIDWLAENAFPDRQTIVDWTAVYCLLWNRLLADKPWAEAEQQRLRSEIGSRPLASVSKANRVKALLYFLIMDEKDTEAMEIAEQESENSEPDFLLPFLHHFFETKNWSRLLLWLRWLLPSIKQADRTTSNRYLEFWRDLYQQQLVDDKQWEQVLAAFLPVSFTEYKFYLMMKQKYQQWVDLHLFYMVSPQEWKSDDLKEIESVHPQLLLPLYHQAAERYLLEKNRDAYKKSVRMLKKLRALYRKLKQLPRWEGFIESFSAKYKRLRAFQEELEKGKLIP